MAVDGVRDPLMYPAPSQVTSSQKQTAGQKRKAESGETPKGRTKRKKA